jgi:HTH-type transcriptional regulator / antitoxin HigA
MENFMRQHPGEILRDLLADRNLSQRELSSIIQVAHSHLSNILTKDRSINIDIAIRLEAAGFNNVKFWMEHQMLYDIERAKKDTDLNEEAENISQWKEIQAHIPVSYFRKQQVLSSVLEENISTIYDMYGVENISQFTKRINTYPFNHFRKSSAFSEKRNNVIAWSLLAESRAAIETKGIKSFNVASKDILVDKLKKLFVENENLIEKVTSLLNSYGIKFLILDRPSKTPVDGKSFMSGENPTIVLSLKYKRLDNFAYTLMHEIGHIYSHLTKPKYKSESFFINNTKNDILEFEADMFARNELIAQEKWDEFVAKNPVFTDGAIYDFANEVKIHPAVVRGRVCFEFNNYYRRKSSINDLNNIGLKPE